MNIIGIHKAGIEEEKKNIATDINVINYAISTLYYKSYMNDINKAREPARKLSDDEIKELKKHNLNEIKIPNLYKCSFKNNTSLILLLYRTKYAWYYTIKNANEIIDDKEIEKYHWNLINTCESFEKINNSNDEKLEPHHEIIIKWLKIKISHRTNKRIVRG